MLSLFLKTTSEMSCTECDSANAKYKCPKCYLKYCSVACCTSHKAKTCEALKKVKRTEGGGDRTSSTEDNVVSRSSDDYVPDSKLALLGESSELRELLQNPHAQAIMRGLVHSNDPARDLAAAMQEPVFVEVADQCLHVVEGRPKQEM